MAVRAAHQKPSKPCLQHSHRPFGARQHWLNLKEYPGIDWMKTLKKQQVAFKKVYINLTALFEDVSLMREDVEESGRKGSTARDLLIKSSNDNIYESVASNGVARYK